MLILEMGADRQGDLAKLVAIAPPTISIVTSVGEAHMEFFGSIGAIAEEKETLVKALPPDGCAILCADDPRVAAMTRRGQVESDDLTGLIAPPTSRLEHRIHPRPALELRFSECA